MPRSLRSLRSHPLVSCALSTPSIALFVVLVVPLMVALAALPAAPAAAQDAAPADAPEARDLVLVLDASGSMWARLGGEEKIVVARRVLGGLVDDLPGASRVGLVAYGHRREGDCDDIETVVPLGPLDRSGLRGAVDALTPRGKTPLTAATAAGLDLLREAGAAGTVILVSDGVETCGGDLCALVREARAEGMDLVLHVVGFGLEGEDAAEVAALECAAQAGGGLYFPADDADALAAALEQAVEAAPEPDATLAVAARSGGEPVDALVRVTRAGEPEGEVAAGRTYVGADTNPRVFGLAAGTYDVEVTAVGIDAAAPVRFAGVEVAEGAAVERTAEFGRGELAVTVRRDDGLGDATVTVLAAGTERRVAAGRTYTEARSNPRVFELAVGTYDVVVESVEVDGAAPRRWEGVEVAPGERVERAHRFDSATLRIGAVAGTERVDATVAIHPADGGRPVASGRTYTGVDTNPKTFVVAPGTWTIRVNPLRRPGAEPRELTLTVGAGETVEESVDVGGG